MNTKLKRAFTALALVLGLSTAVTAASVASQVTAVPVASEAVEVVLDEVGTADALGNCSAWYYSAYAGGGWRGGRSRCTSVCGPCGNGIQRVIVYCSNGVFVKGPWVGVNQISSALCASGARANGVWEEAP